MTSIADLLKSARLVDPQLNRLIQDLRRQNHLLSISSRDGDAKAHYEAALEICRITRRIRFRIEIDSLDWDTKTELLKLYDESINGISNDPMFEPDGKALKTLQEVKANVTHRSELIADPFEEQVRLENRPQEGN